MLMASPPRKGVEASRYPSRSCMHASHITHAHELAPEHAMAQELHDSAVETGSPWST